jgi:hypothetical protein
MKNKLAVLAIFMMMACGFSRIPTDKLIKSCGGAHLMGKIATGNEIEGKFEDVIESERRRCDRLVKTEPELKHFNCDKGACDLIHRLADEK